MIQVVTPKLQWTVISVLPSPVIDGKRSQHNMVGATVAPGVVPELSQRRNSI